MLAFLLDEALALRLQVEALAATSKRSTLPAGMRYESARDVPRPGPVRPGPAAHIIGGRG